MSPPFQKARTPFASKLIIINYICPYSTCCSPSQCALFVYALTLFVACHHRSKCHIMHTHQRPPLTTVVDQCLHGNLFWKNCSHLYTHAAMGTSFGSTARICAHTQQWEPLLEVLPASVHTRSNGNLFWKYCPHLHTHTQQ